MLMLYHKPLLGEKRDLVLFFVLASSKIHYSHNLANWLFHIQDVFFFSLIKLGRVPDLCCRLCTCELSETKQV